MRKRTVVSLSSVRYLNGQLSQNIEKTILILIVCKGTKKKNQIQIQNQYRDIQEPTLFQFKSSNEKIVMVDQYGNFWANPLYSRQG